MTLCQCAPVILSVMLTLLPYVSASSISWVSTLKAVHLWGESGGSDSPLTRSLRPRMALRPTLDGGAGVGAAGAVPTAAAAPLPAPSPPASAPQNILATPASLFSEAAKGLPLPQPAQRLPGAPLPRQQPVLA